MELAPALPACITAQLGTDFNLILTYDVKNSVILKMAKSGSVILIMFQCGSALAHCQWEQEDSQTHWIAHQS